MSKKHKHKRIIKKLKAFRFRLVVVLVGFGFVGLVVQAGSQNLARARHEPRYGAQTIAEATAGTPVATAPAVTPGPTPAQTKARVVYRPVHHYAPPVKPVAHSNVSHLVAVASPPPAAPTPTPGRGSGGAGSGGPTPPPASYVYTSSNWSGYLAAQGKFTSVSGSWAVPSVSGSLGVASADTAWVGIGGVTSQDLIQAGTFDTISRSGQVSYFAFYELLPGTAVAVQGMTVGAADVMKVSLAEQTAGHWQITIVDASRGENFSISVAYASSESTAEWIEEDPSYASGAAITFDHFGSVRFSEGATTENGVSRTILQTAALAIVLVNSQGQAAAVPSVLSAAGDAFQVTGL